MIALSAVRPPESRIRCTSHPADSPRRAPPANFHVFETHGGGFERSQTEVGSLFADADTLGIAINDECLKATIALRYDHKVTALRREWHQSFDPAEAVPFARFSCRSANRRDVKCEIRLHDGDTRASILLAGKQRQQVLLLRRGSLRSDCAEKSNRSSSPRLRRRHHGDCELFKEDRVQRRGGSRVASLSARDCMMPVDQISSEKCAGGSTRGHRPRAPPDAGLSSPAPGSLIARASVPRSFQKRSRLVSSVWELNLTARLRFPALDIFLGSEQGFNG